MKDNHDAEDKFSIAGKPFTFISLTTIIAAIIGYLFGLQTPPKPDYTVEEIASIIAVIFGIGGCVIGIAGIIMYAIFGDYWRYHLVDDVQELKQLLRVRLRHYETILRQHKMDLPDVSRVNKMHTQDHFIRYIGTPSIHDAIIKHIRQTDNTIKVELLSYTKKLLTIEFTGVKSVLSNKPEGMILYSVSEMSCEVDLMRRFVFVNWDEENGSVLEIIADDFLIQEIE